MAATITRRQLKVVEGADKVFTIVDEQTGEAVANYHGTAADTAPGVYDKLFNRFKGVAK